MLQLIKQQNHNQHQMSIT